MMFSCSVFGILVGLVEVKCGNCVCGQKSCVVVF